MVVSGELLDVVSAKEMGGFRLYMKRSHSRIILNYALALVDRPSSAKHAKQVAFQLLSSWTMGYSLMGMERREKQ